MESDIQPGELGQASSPSDTQGTAILHQRIPSSHSWEDAFRSPGKRQPVSWGSWREGQGPGGKFSAGRMHSRSQGDGYGWGEGLANLLDLVKFTIELESSHRMP